MSESSNKIAALEARIKQLEARLGQQDIMNAAFQSQIGQNQNQMNCMIYQITPNPNQDSMVTTSPSDNEPIINTTAQIVSPIGTPSDSPTPSEINDPKDVSWPDMVDEVENESLTNSKSKSSDKSILKDLFNSSESSDTPQEDKQASYATMTATSSTPNKPSEDGFELVVSKHKPYTMKFNSEYYLNPTNLGELIKKLSISVQDINDYKPYDSNTIYCGYLDSECYFIATLDLALKLANIEPSSIQCNNYHCMGFMCAKKHSNDKGYSPGLSRFSHGICIFSFMGYKCNDECRDNPNTYHHRIKDDDNKKECPPHSLKDIWKCPPNEYHQDCVFGSDEGYD